MRLSDTRICIHCGKEYELGFFGTGKQFCSQECRRQRYKYQNGILKRSLYKAKDKDRLICGRSIKEVGLRSNINKYCSKKCMYTANKMKRKGQKTIRVRIPVESMKTIVIPISELPRLFKR